MADNTPPGPCPVCRAAGATEHEHCQRHVAEPRWDRDVPTPVEIGSDGHLPRIRAARLVGGPRHRLPEWWWSLLLGPDARRLDIVTEGALRVGVTIDGERAMDGRDDIIRWPDGRLEVIFTCNTDD